MVSLRPGTAAGPAPFAFLLKRAWLLFKSSGRAFVFALTVGTVNVLEIYFAASKLCQSPGAYFGWLRAQPDFLGVLFPKIIFGLRFFYELVSYIFS